jgi:hypothetical protein
VELSVRSRLPLHRALVSIGQGESYSPPLPLVGHPRRSGSIEVTTPKVNRLRWAFVVNGASYYAETSALFVDRKTLMPEER